MIKLVTIFLPLCMALAQSKQCIVIKFNETTDLISTISNETYFRLKPSFNTKKGYDKFKVLKRQKGYGDSKLISKKEANQRVKNFLEKKIKTIKTLRTEKKLDI